MLFGLESLILNGTYYFTGEGESCFDINIIQSARCFISVFNIQANWVNVIRTGLRYDFQSLTEVINRLSIRFFSSEVKELFRIFSQRQKFKYDGDSRKVFSYYFVGTSCQSVMKDSRAVYWWVINFSRFVEIS